MQDGSEYEAQPVAGAVVVQAHYELEGQGWLVVDIPAEAGAYPAFFALPAALRFGGRVYGKSAFDSDRGRAYYRTGQLVAVERRIRA